MKRHIIIEIEAADVLPMDLPGVIAQRIYGLGCGDWKVKAEWMEGTHLSVRETSPVPEPMERPA